MALRLAGAWGAKWGVGVGGGFADALINRHGHRYDRCSNKVSYIDDQRSANTSGLS